MTQIHLKNGEIIKTNLRANQILSLVYRADLKPVITFIEIQSKINDRGYLETNPNRVILFHKNINFIR